MSALGTRGGRLAVAVTAVLVVVVGLAAAGVFDGGSVRPAKVGRPSAAVTDSPHGGVGAATAKVIARSVGARPADTWAEIGARELIDDAFERYGYFPRMQEFIARGDGRRIHSANIIALKEGQTADRLVVGAHYDSAEVGEGYLDNATGIGLLLEVAARVKHVPTPYTIVFVAFGAGESGRLGARHYVKTLTDVDRKATIGMIDLAAPAGGDTLTVMSRPGGATWLRDDALSAAEHAHVPLVTSPKGRGRPAGTVKAPGDDAPFAEQGIPTAVFSAVSWGAGGRPRMDATLDGRPLWGTPRDTVAYVDRHLPRRVRTQLRHMSLLLETLLTSELERRP